jgi:hypothetical protein
VEHVTHQQMRTATSHFLHWFLRSYCGWMRESEVSVESSHELATAPLLEFAEMVAVGWVSLKRRVKWRSSRAVDTVLAVEKEYHMEMKQRPKWSCSIEGEVAHYNYYSGADTDLLAIGIEQVMVKHTAEAAHHCIAEFHCVEGIEDFEVLDNFDRTAYLALDYRNAGQGFASRVEPQDHTAAEVAADMERVKQSHTC